MEAVVAGSYDRFLFGYQCSTSGRDEATSLIRSFTYPAHKGPVKCIAASAPYLVSGGADDLIHLYDLQADVDLGFLMSPGDGAVSALAFHATAQHRHPSHLLSGAADGSLSIWQAGGEWVCLKTFHGHKKEINSITVHLSGRLALSVSQDSTLRLWNLVKGKSAYESQLSTPAGQVAFTPTGKSYGILQGTEVLLQDIGEAPRAILHHQRRALCLATAAETEILTGSEDGSIRLWDSRAPEQPAILLSDAHQTRVKAIAPTSSSLEAQSTSLVTSASSDGILKLWDFRMIAAKSKGKPVPAAQAATGARLTCLASFDPNCAVASKIKAAQATTQEKGRMNQDKDGPAKSAPSKAAALSGKAEKPKALAGVAHDGVVDFTEALPSKAKGRKQKKGSIGKALHRPFNGAAKLKQDAPRPSKNSRRKQSA